MEKTQRIYKFDNIKFFCIILVVFGHFLEVYCDDFTRLRPLFLIIYTFHMPLFLFIYGLFTKKKPEDKSFNINTFTFYIVVGFLLKLLIHLEKLIANKHPNFYWFKEDGIPWFMFVIAAYMLFEFAVRKLPPMVVMIGSFIVGGFCGYIPFIGDTLCSSRILVFLPFFFAGYYLTPEKTMEFTSKRWVRLTSIGISLVYIVVCFVNIDFVYGLRKLFTGKNPFRNVLIDNCGVQHRLLAYVISIILCIAIISIIPNIKIPVITKMGMNTLSVFFWHMLVKYILLHTGAFYFFDKLGIELTWILVMFILSIIISMILMIDVFIAPLKALQKLINRFKPIGCVLILGALAVAGCIFTFVIH